MVENTLLDIQYCDTVVYIVGGIGDMPNLLQEASIDVITAEYCSELWVPTPIGGYHVCLLDTESLDSGSCNVCCSPYAFLYEISQCYSKS